MNTIGVIALFFAGIIVGFSFASWVFITISAEVARNATAKALEKAEQLVRDAS